MNRIAQLLTVAIGGGAALYFYSLAGGRFNFINPRKENRTAGGLFTSGEAGIDESLEDIPTPDTSPPAPFFSLPTLDDITPDFLNDAMDAVIDFFSSSQGIDEFLEDVPTPVLERTRQNFAATTLRGGAIPLRPPNNRNARRGAPFINGAPGFEDFTAQFTGNYDALIYNAAMDWGVDPSILKQQLIAESSLNPAAVGRQTRSGQARGIAQFLPATWSDVLANGWAPAGSEPTDAAAAIPAAAAYMRWLLEQVNGNYAAALAAYNFGIGNVQRRRPLPPETRDYVQNVLMRAKGDEAANVIRAAGITQ